MCTCGGKASERRAFFSKKTQKNTIRKVSYVPYSVRSMRMAKGDVTVKHHPPTPISYLILFLLFFFFFFLPLSLNFQFSIFHFPFSIFHLPSSTVPSLLTEYDCKQEPPERLYNPLTTSISSSRAHNVLSFVPPKPCSFLSCLHRPLQCRYPGR